MRNQKDLVSIIVPIYNCEKYIDSLLKSLINQTYRNLEILLINDGSTDGTIDKCNKYSKDKRIKIVNQNNSGVSAARNNGMERCLGKYIYFSDADDYLELNAIESIVNIMKKENVELVTTGFCSEVFDKNDKLLLSDKIYLNDKKYSNKDEIKNDLVLLFDKHLLYNVWNKLYLKEIIDKNNLKFPNYNWGEDLQFNRDYLMCISNMYNSSLCIYHYIRSRSMSATDKYIKDLYKKRVQEYFDFCDFFDKNNISKEDYMEFVARRHIERVLGCVDNILKKESKYTFKEKYKIVKKYVNDELTRKCLKEMKPQSKKIKILIIPYKLKLILAVIINGIIIGFVREKIPHLFHKLKNRR